MKLLLLCALAAVMLSASSCYRAESRSKYISDISLAPVSTFRERCSRCHGYEGAAYGKSLAQMKERALQGEVEGMMFGQGELQPDSTEVLAMCAYVVSLRDRKPFAIVLNSRSFLEGREDTLKIETSPRTVLRTDENDVMVSHRAGFWDIMLDQAKVKTIRFRIERDKESGSFTFPEEIWSGE